MRMPISANMQPQITSYENLPMCQKDPYAQYPEAFDPMGMNFRSFEQQQQMMLKHLRRQKKKNTQPLVPVEQHNFFIAIVLDEDTGRIRKQYSSKLQDYKDQALSDATDHLVAYLESTKWNGALSTQKTHQVEHQAAAMTPTTSQESLVGLRQQSSKKRKADRKLSIPEYEPRQNASIRQDEEEPEDVEPPMIRYHLNDTERWTQWMADAFRAVQQVSCRVIAKEWIKTIHPKKQSTHPYNGKNPRTGERGDSNSTRPPYWPADVIHKEPDHINKEARTKLLVHLLMHTPHREMTISGEAKNDKEITAENLKEALEQKRLERQMDQLRKKFHIIDEIIAIRTQLERYNDGGFPSGGYQSATDYSEFNRGRRNDDDSDDPDEVLDASEQDLAEEDDMDIAAAVPQDEIVVIAKEPTAKSQPTRGNGKGSKSHKVSKRASTNDDPRAPKVSRPRVSSTQYADYSVHPPQFPPGWESLQASPTILKPEHMTHPGQQIATPYQLQEALWNQQMRPSMEMIPEWNDHSMVSPQPMPNTAAHNAFAEQLMVSCQQQPFARTPLPQHFGRPPDYPMEMSDRRQMPIRGSMPYEGFMMQSPHGHDAVHRAFYL